MVIRAPRCSTAVQNHSGAIAAEVWNIQHPFCISFTTAIVCFASGTMAENKSCILGAWGGSCNRMQTSIHVDLRSQYNSLGQRKGQIFSSLNISVLCPLVRSHTDSLEGEVLCFVQESSQAQQIRDHHSLWVAYSPGAELPDLI